MILAVDIGNTKQKIALFKEGVLIQIKHFKNLTVKDVKIFLELIDEKVNHVIICAVNEYAKELDVFFKNCFKTFLVVNSDIKLPFNNNYKTPATLGPDRLALVAAAMEIYPGNNVLVMDSGSCLTYDLIDKDGVYHGGAISPGLNMRFRAMHTFTGKLPLVVPEVDDEPEITGDSTVNSMESGVVNGMISEITGMIEKFEVQFPELKILMTGGDCKVFEKHIKKPIFADPNLIFKGLNKLLTFNIE